MKRTRNDRRAKARPRAPQPTMPRNDLGRIEMLKRKLEVIQRQIVAAASGDDQATKTQLDLEAADLKATIFRAESLGAR
ncbi:MAG: hypothetical protein K9N62_02585 [Verrucomicrobia bacterium]|nr:hypothetical protein [Verrucomicrobiota bacterium]